MYIVIGIFSYWFAVESGIPQYISGVLFNFGIKKRYHESYIPIRLKPFDCEKCLGFWLGLIYYYDTCILMAGITSFAAILTGLIIKKLK